MSKIWTKDREKVLQEALESYNTQEEVAEYLTHVFGFKVTARAVETAKGRLSANIEGISAKKLLAENKMLKSQVKTLTSDNDSLQGYVESARSANQKRYIGKAKKHSKRKIKTRVIIPDTHGSSIDKVAAAVFLSDLKILDPDEIVMLGDHLECDGFLAQHHTLGYVAQTAYTYEDDIAAGNQFLDRVIENAPHATIDYLEGNHERRLERWVITQTLRNGRDAEWLRKQIAPEYVLKLKERGIKYYRQSENYQDICIPGTIKKGKCYFTHGIGAVKHSAAKHIERFADNVIFGHTHRRDSYTINTVSKPTIGAYSPGCLCKKQPTWMHTNPSDWTQGFGVQTVLPSGKFQHVNVVITNGESLLTELLRAR